MPVVALVLFAFCDKKRNFSKLIVSQPQLCGNWSPHQATQFRWWIVKKSLEDFSSGVFHFWGSLVNLHRVVCLMWSMIFEMTDDSWMQISEAFQFGAISVRITPHRHSSSYYQSKNLMIVDEGNIFFGICCHYFLVRVCSSSIISSQGGMDVTNILAPSCVHTQTCLQTGNFVQTPAQK